MLVLVASHPRYFPALAVLPALHSHTRHSTGRLQRQQCHRQHRGRRAPAGPRGLLRNLREPRRRLVVVQQQRDDPGERGVRRPGPAQPHLAGQPV